MNPLKPFEAVPKSSTDLNSLDTSIVNDNDEDENSFKIVFETGGDDSESEEEEQEYPEESEVSANTFLRVRGKRVLDPKRVLGPFKISSTLFPLFFL